MAGYQYGSYQQPQFKRQPSQPGQPPMPGHAGNPAQPGMAPGMNQPPTPAAPATGQPGQPQRIPFACDASDNFAAWLHAVKGSILVTTYQANKVILVGLNNGQISILMRDIPKPMGVHYDKGRLFMATKLGLQIYANTGSLAQGYPESPQTYDGLFLPRVTYHTNDLFLHDVGLDNEGLIMVNTRYCCLARPDWEYNFRPVWQPHFLSERVPEDRCHLNGLAIKDGIAKTVTCLGTTDTAGGWRDNKYAGGVLMDVPTNEIITTGLCMPHSPRWHDGHLYFLNSGAGQLCRYTSDGKFDVVCQLNGYLRGLHIMGPYALVGMSQVREKHIFGNQLPIQQQFKTLRCGMCIVDMVQGKEIAHLEFTQGCTETFDVHFLPGTTRPNLITYDRQSTQQALCDPDFGFWLEGKDKDPNAGMPPGATPPGGHPQGFPPKHAMPSPGNPHPGQPPQQRPGTPPAQGGYGYQ